MSQNFDVGGSNWRRSERSGAGTQRGADAAKERRGIRHEVGSPAGPANVRFSGSLALAPASRASARAIATAAAATLGLKIPAAGYANHTGTRPVRLASTVRIAGNVRLSSSPLRMPAPADVDVAPARDSAASPSSPSSPPPVVSPSSPSSPPPVVSPPEPIVSQTPILSSSPLPGTTDAERHLLRTSGWGRARGPLTGEAIETTDTTAIGNGAADASPPTPGPTPATAPATFAASPVALSRTPLVAPGTQLSPTLLSPLRLRAASDELLLDRVRKYTGAPDGSMRLRCEQQALDEMWGRFRSFVMTVTNDFSASVPYIHGEMGDLESISSLTAMQAFRQFDPTRGVPLRAYLRATVKQQLCKTVARLSKDRVSEEARRYRKFIKGDMTPEDEARLRAEKNLRTEEDVEDFKRQHAYVMVRNESMDDSSSSGRGSDALRAHGPQSGESLTLMETIADQSQPDLDSLLLLMCLKERMNGLDASRRTALDLVCFQGFKPTEAAHIMDLEFTKFHRLLTSARREVTTIGYDVYVGDRTILIR